MESGEKILLIVFLLIIVSIIAFSVGTANAPASGISGAATAPAPSFTQSVGRGCGT